MNNDRKFNREPGRVHYGLWLASLVVSILLFGVLSYQWTKARQFDPSSNQMASQTQVDQVLERYAKDMDLDRADITGLSTGAFIQSLSFSDTSEVYLTGYLWQRYINELPDDPYAPWKDSCEHDVLPWVLPDRVRLGDDKDPRLAYSEVIRGKAIDDESAPPKLGMLCGWFFEATLRQDFNYRRYPFDNTIISLRIFSENPNPLTAVLHYRDNIVPKLLYWPVVLSSSVVWTHFMLFADV